MKILSKLINGVACCILNLPCCKPPDSSVKALGTFIREAGGKQWAQNVCESVAEAILSECDLVPKGVGKAIGEAYYPIIKHVLDKDKDTDDEIPMTTT